MFQNVFFIKNQSDEDKLGVKYKEIENYMNDVDSVDKETAKKIKKLHDNNQHKFNTPTYRRYEF